MEIDTNAVLEAAGTKWNFLPFKPGLVGGHCIGVDPYYLAQKAQELGYHPEIILAGRRLNDSMGEYVASQVVKLMIKKGIQVNGAELLMLGITFKENCPDVRNTKIVDVVAALKDYGINVTIYDPWANPAEVMHEYNLLCHTELPTCHSEFNTERSRSTASNPSPITHHDSCHPELVSGTLDSQTKQSLVTIKFDAIVLGVAHQEFKTLNLEALKKDNAIVYDVKGIFKNEVDGRLL
jgi:UDP-N-acetyl-D-galactosamine dehydrogenase